MLVSHLDILVETSIGLPLHFSTQSFETNPWLLATYLNGQLSGRAKHDSLDLSGAEQVVFAQIFSDWQTEGQSLATAGQVASDHVLPVEHRVKTVLLDWEKVCNASCR